MLRKLLEDTPPQRAEWILFVQPDSFIDDISFAFPFDSYRGKDLILLGNATQLRQGDFRGNHSSLIAALCLVESLNREILE